MLQVDGKVVNAATRTSSAMRCSMCGMTWSHFNKLEEAAAKQVTNLQYGLDTLHCWIRTFEGLLRLSCRLPDGNASKEQIEARRRVVQEKFKAQMGLRVDEPL